MPSDGRETCSYALQDGERMLVLDAGTGMRRLVTQPQLVDGVERLDVVLSHFHLDHVIGLTYLSALARKLLVVVHGPGRWLYDRPTSAILDDLVTSPFQPTSLQERRIEVRDIDADGWTWGNHDLLYRHQATHTAPSVAIRMDDCLAYCTDTAYDEGNALFARGVSVLMHEAWSDSLEDTAGHSTPAEAAAIARMAAVDQLLLIHVAPTASAVEMASAAAEIFPRCAVAGDHQVLEFGEELR